MVAPTVWYSYILKWQREKGGENLYTNGRLNWARHLLYRKEINLKLPTNQRFIFLSNSTNYVFTFSFFHHVNYLDFREIRKEAANKWCCQVTLLWSLWSIHSQQEDRMGLKSTPYSRSTDCFLCQMSGYLIGLLYYDQLELKEEARTWLFVVQYAQSAQLCS